MTDRPNVTATSGATPPGAAGSILSEAPKSQWADAWDQFTHHRGAMAGCSASSRSSSS
jgi:hypothetical protein